MSDPTRPVVVGTQGVVVAERSNPRRELESGKAAARSALHTIHRVAEEARGANDRVPDASPTDRKSSLEAFHVAQEALRTARKALKEIERAIEAGKRAVVRIYRVRPGLGDRNLAIANAEAVMKQTEALQPLLDAARDGRRTVAEINADVAAIRLRVHGFMREDSRRFQDEIHNANECGEALDRNAGRFRSTPSPQK